MTTPRLNLIALRVADIDRAAGFYGALGLQFLKHAHGTGPQHYACESEGFVFELYASTSDQPISASARIGFMVDDVDEAAARLGAIEGARIVSAPKDSPWGRRAVVADPDGHRVELVGRAPS